LQDTSELVDYMDEISHEISKAKGEKLVNFKINNSKPLKEYILTFKALNDHDMSHAHTISIKADSLKVVKQDIDLKNVFYNVGPDEVVGKKFQEYEDWHKEKLVDTGNLTGPHSNLTLLFEDGYSMEIEKITY
jgi:hypothetical protein